MRARFFLVTFASITVTTANAADPAKGVDFFEKKIRPVLVEQCYKCHSADAKKFKGGLALDTRAGLIQGGDTGPAIAPGDAKKSLLIKALKHDGLKMPNETMKLPDAVIADFEAWITAGATDPRDGKSPVKKGIDYVEGRKHWSYQPVRVPPVPTVKNSVWAKTDFDKYVLSKVEAKGLAPAADATPSQLIRRMTFAITGLPPTPEETAAFEADSAKNPDAAVAAAADRLLASPRFGEYWAVHWMDGVRFDQLHQSSDIYRAWLIRAFNSGLPYDQFVKYQLAGDLLPPSGTKEVDEDRLTATHMLTLNLGEMDYIEGCVEVVGQQFLGVSINCAKCHDHKFDAYTQQDYYALAGVFTSTGTAGFVKADFPAYEVAGGKVMGLKDVPKKIGDTKLLIRGEKSTPGAVVPRRFPLVLAGDTPTPLSQLTKGSGRLELANWIADAKNPLTARVMANRIWMWTTGIPLVGTPNDFGVVGEKPINPELLDALSAKFAGNWSVKGLVKDIVTSRTFRQSATPTAGVQAADPQNQLLARMPVRRLDAEQIVDALYFVGGVLDCEPPPLGTKLAGRGAPKKNNDKNFLGAYRAVYGIGTIPAAMFDAADPDLLTIRRDESVTAPQMLFFLNNPTVHKLAAVIAKRAGNVDAAARILLGRGLTAAEKPAAEAFAKKNGLERYCHLLLCSSEFCYVE